MPIAFSGLEHIHVERIAQSLMRFCAVAAWSIFGPTMAAGIG
jgi:hypothetical protein